MAWQKINIQVPTDLNPQQRIELADLVIEHIFKRTDSGVDKDGMRFPKYSEAYKKSLDFKNAGKTSKVDLQLSGDMLAAMQLLNHRPGNLMIGFVNGTEENAKAEGNILGSYGGNPDPSRARDFLGIEEKKLKELIDYVKSSSGSE